MPNPIFTHLLNIAGDRLCCREDGPAVAATALLDDTTAANVVFCPSCARAVIATVVELAQARSKCDPLIDVINALTTTPPGEETAVLRLLEPALTALADYVGVGNG